MNKRNKGKKKKDIEYIHVQRNKKKMCKRAQGLYRRGCYRERFTVLGPIRDVLSSSFQIGQNDYLCERARPAATGHIFFFFFLSLIHVFTLYMYHCLFILNACAHSSVVLAHAFKNQTAFAKKNFIIYITRENNFSSLECLSKF